MDKLCPECGHVDMHSEGRLAVQKSSLWNKLRRRKQVSAWVWTCYVGFGPHWTVPECGCNHPFHYPSR